jgi:hypothetical protein
VANAARREEGHQAKGEACVAQPNIAVAGGGLLAYLAARACTKEDKCMTRTDLELNQEGMWRTLVFEQRTTLTLAVEMLLRCHLSPEQILTKTANALGGSLHDS